MNRSFLRSVSPSAAAPLAHSYPYPRTHTTVMVIPSQRPFAAEDAPPGYVAPKVRRPPLNRAIPTIPESKSNESIMSHMTHVSEKASTPGEDMCTVFENKMVSKIPVPKQVIRPAPRQQQSVPPPAAPAGPTRGQIHKKGPPATSRPTRQDPPRSPLMTVAHNVKSRISRLVTREPKEKRDMRGSASMSQIKPPSTRAAISKSSSMDGPSSSGTTTTGWKRVERREDKSETVHPPARPTLVVLPRTPLSPDGSPRREEKGPPSTIMEVSEREDPSRSEQALPCDAPPTESPPTSSSQSQPVAVSSDEHGSSSQMSLPPAPPSEAPPTSMSTPPPSDTPEDESQMRDIDADMSLRSSLICSEHVSVILRDDCRLEVVERVEAPPIQATPTAHQEELDQVEKDLEENIVKKAVVLLEATPLRPMEELASIPVVRMEEGVDGVEEEEDEILVVTLEGTPERRHGRSISPVPTIDRSSIMDRPPDVIDQSPCRTIDRSIHHDSPSVQKRATESLSDQLTSVLTPAASPEEEHASPPVFHCPAPPPMELTTQGTSPIRESPRRSSSPPPLPPSTERVTLLVSPKSHAPIRTDSKKERSEKAKRQAAEARERREAKERAEKERRDAERARREQEKADRQMARSAEKPKTPLSARGIKSFLMRRQEKSKPKPPPTSKSMPHSLSPKPMRLNVVKTFAPLAEFESSVVENSPMVEQPGGDWADSPRSRRRHSELASRRSADLDRLLNNVLSSDTGESSSSTLEADNNGNPTTVMEVPAGKWGSPPASSSVEDKGLIDDEIFDQPMLVGDSFSASPSVERLSLILQNRNPAEDQQTIISIDRSVYDDMSRRSAHPTDNNANGSDTQGSQGSVPSPQLKQTLSASLSEVDDIREQLKALQAICERSEKTSSSGSLDLVAENEKLREQLRQRDDLIASLQRQIAGLSV